MQKGERFRMIDPPSLPLKPDFPDRLKFCGIGVGFGLALGLVVAGGFEFMDDRLHSEKEIKALLPMKVISEIPEIVIPSDERKSKRRLWLGWAMAALVFAIYPGGFCVQLPATVKGHFPMYKAFFNLTRNPFELTPDPRFLFSTRRHNEALAALYYGVRRHKGFVVVTGEVGPGKPCCFGACCNC